MLSDASSMSTCRLYESILTCPTPYPRCMASSKSRVIIARFEPQGLSADRSHDQAILIRFAKQGVFQRPNQMLLHHSRLLLIQIPAVILIFTMEARHLLSRKLALPPIRQLDMAGGDDHGACAWLAGHQIWSPTPLWVETRPFWKSRYKHPIFI